MDVRRAAACSEGAGLIMIQIMAGRSEQSRGGRTLASWMAGLVHARAESTERQVALAGESNGDESNVQVL